MLIDRTRQYGHLRRDLDVELQLVLERDLNLHGSWLGSRVRATVDAVINWLSATRDSGHWADISLWPGLQPSSFPDLQRFDEIQFGWDPLGGVEPVWSRQPSWPHPFSANSKDPFSLSVSKHQAIDALPDPVPLIPVWVDERRILEDAGRPTNDADEIWEEKPCQWQWILWLEQDDLKWEFLGGNEAGHDWDWGAVRHNDDGIRVDVEWPPPPKPDPPTKRETFDHIQALRTATKIMASQGIDTSEMLRSSWADIMETWDEIQNPTSDLNSDSSREKYRVWGKTGWGN